jgi:hypothetical protein
MSSPNGAAELNNQGLSNNQSRYSAWVKSQASNAQGAVQAERLAVQAKDEKASGVSWTKNGSGDSVISTRKETDTLSLSSTSVSLSSTDAAPLATRVADTVKSGLNSFRRALIDGLYGKIEEAVRKEYSYDAMQARFAASDLDGIMSKMFLRLGPEILAALGEENPAEKIDGIKTRAVAQLKTENTAKLGELERSNVRMMVYGNA